MSAVAHSEFLQMLRRIIWSSPAIEALDELDGREVFEIQGWAYDRVVAMPGGGYTTSFAMPFETPPAGVTTDPDAFEAWRATWPTVAVVVAGPAGHVEVGKR